MSSTLPAEPGSRRAFLQNGLLVLAAGSLNHKPLWGSETTRPLRIGMMTDLHYADKTTNGSRHYRDTPAKLAVAAEQFARSAPDLLIELGDLIDAAESVAIEQKYLKTINEQFSQICKNRHYVLGNHCVDTLTKSEFLDGVEQEKSYYSFKERGIHFIVLDACFRSDGVAYQRKNFDWTDTNIPVAELEWLQADLKAATGPVIVLAHQRLDVSNSHGVRNGGAVRKILEMSGKVQAVFQGHSHFNHLSDINGIYYCTMAGMIEGPASSRNAFALIDIHSDGRIEIQGFGQQQAYEWC